MPFSSANDSAGSDVTALRKSLMRSANVQSRETLYIQKDGPFRASLDRARIASRLRPDTVRRGGKSLNSVVARRKSVELHTVTTQTRWFSASVPSSRLQDEAAVSVLNREAEPRLAAKRQSATAPQRAAASAFAAQRNPPEARNSRPINSASSIDILPDRDEQGNDATNNQRQSEIAQPLRSISRIGPGKALHAFEKLHNREFFLCVIQEANPSDLAVAGGLR
jgi:hypothetical protein